MIDNEQSLIVNQAISSVQTDQQNHKFEQVSEQISKQINKNLQQQQKIQKSKDDQILQKEIQKIQKNIIDQNGQHIQTKQDTSQNVSPSLQKNQIQSAQLEKEQKNQFGEGQVITAQEKQLFISFKSPNHISSEQVQQSPNKDFQSNSQKSQEDQKSQKNQSQEYQKPNILSQQVSMQFEAIEISRESVSNSQTGNYQKQSILAPQLKKYHSQQIINYHDQIKQENKSQTKSIQQKQQQQIINTQIIITQAIRQRIYHTYNLLCRYVDNSDKFRKGHSILIENIREEIQRRKKYRTVTQYIIKDHFIQYGKMLKEFHSQSITYSAKQISQKNGNIANPMINMGLQLIGNYNQLYKLRSVTGFLFYQAEQKIQNIIGDIIVIFTSYQKELNQKIQHLKKVKSNFQQTQKLFQKYTKRIKSLYSSANFSQGDDLFVEMVKFVKLDKTLRVALVQYGTQLIKFYQQFVRLQIKLFSSISNVLLDFKNYSSVKFIPMELFNFQEKSKFLQQITQGNELSRLCSLTDLDYLNYLFKIIQNSQKKQVRRTYQKLISLKQCNMNSIFGNSMELLKGSINKIFNLKEIDQQMISTISGNLIHFNSKQSNCISIFKISHLILQPKGNGIVEFQYREKRFIKDIIKIQQYKFKDQDHAEQIIMAFNKQGQQ